MGEFPYSISHSGGLTLNCRESSAMRRSAHDSMHSGRDSATGREADADATSAAAARVSASGKAGTVAGTAQLQSVNSTTPARMSPVPTKHDSAATLLSSRVISAPTA